MDKVKILAIVPYTGLKELLLETAKNFENIEIHAYVADMSEGLKLARAIPHDDYSVIISRAGTAKLIEQVSTVPVVDVGISVYDMLRAIRLAQSYNGKFAVVGFRAISKYAIMINDLLQYQVDVFTVNQEQEIDTCLNHLKDNGYSLIVGDVITISHARGVGLNTVLVTSGQESVQTALEQSIKWQTSNARVQKQNNLQKEILRKMNTGIAVFDFQGKKLYSISPFENPVFSQLEEELVKYIDAAVENQETKVIKRAGNLLFNVNAQVMEYDAADAVVFCYKVYEDVAKTDANMVTYKNLDDAPTVNLETFTTSSAELKNVIDMAKRFSTTTQPILIEGQRGCGKDTFAYAIYRNSSFNCNPLITIDCKLTSAKQWTALLESENSPLGNSGCTIYFKNLHLLSDTQQMELENYIRSTDVHKRNRMIFSCVPGYSEAFDKGSLWHYVHDGMKSLSLLIPTLNERREDIPNLATLYLNEMNSKMVKQVIGLQPGALKALQEFNWRNNLDQFHRVIQELMILTDSSYISEKITLEVLKKEGSSLHSTAGNLQIDLSGTLDEITTSVVKYVLEQENMNQSKAAKRLNISRGTLWRKIQ